MLPREDPLTLLQRRMNALNIFLRSGDPRIPPMLDMPRRRFRPYRIARTTIGKYDLSVFSTATDGPGTATLRVTALGEHIGKLTLRNIKWEEALREFEELKRRVMELWRAEQAVWAKYTKE